VSDRHGHPAMTRHATRYALVHPESKPGEPLYVHKSARRSTARSTRGFLLWKGTTSAEDAKTWATEEGAEAWRDREAPSYGLRAVAVAVPVDYLEVTP
jgi:hypothetical protein